MLSVLMYYIQSLKEEPMQKVLITGGPVFEHLDDVKIITNTFKGKWMVTLSEILYGKGCEVVYLTSKGQPQPHDGVRTLHHVGFSDYMNKVLSLSKEFDAVVLGAAVANLIPYKRFEGKFPSHNYKPGDIIPIDFTIAPRVIDQVKQSAPNTHLFGFKLLSGVDHEELVSAAYGVLLESKATTIFANDKNDLSVRYAITKERSRHKLDINGVAQWICESMEDAYYSTQLTKHRFVEDVRIDEHLEQYKDKFIPCKEGYVFGTVAVRRGQGFITTVRGKKSLGEQTYVTNVDHQNRVIHVVGNSKATLNAPLLSHIFNTFSNVESIVHYHEIENSLDTYPYAHPGTVRDSIRSLSGKSFNIEEHGCFILFDKNMNKL